MKTLLRLTFMVAVLLATALSASADDFYLAGEFNEWTAGDANYKFTGYDNGKYYLIVDGSAIAGKQFKVVYNGGWYSNSTEFNSSNEIAYSKSDKEYILYSSDEANSIFSNSLTGKYLFRCYKNNADVNFAFTPIDDFYLVGDFNKWTVSDDYRLTTTDDITYTFKAKTADIKGKEFKIYNGKTWGISWGSNSTVTSEDANMFESGANSKCSDALSSDYCLVTFKFENPYLSKVSVSEYIDNASFDLNAEVVTYKDLKKELEANEGFSDRWPAYYTNINAVKLSYSFTGGMPGASYELKISAMNKDTELASVTDAVTASADGSYSLPDDRFFYLPYADSYVLTVTSVKDTDADNIGTRSTGATTTAQLSFPEFSVVSPDMIIVSSNALVANFVLQGIDSDCNPYVTFNVPNAAVASDEFTSLGLEGYKHREENEDYVDGNHNWSYIAGQVGHLPLHIQNVDTQSDIEGTISVVYPFLNNNDSDENLQKVTKTVSVKITADEIGNAQTAVSDIMVDANDSEAAYYNLQGIRVANPQSGNIYILRRGLTAQKLIFK
jgi:hypothetical protein